MYIPKARKLPSGNWQCRVTVEKGQPPISIVKSTKREAEQAAAAIKSGAKRAVTTNRTVYQAIDAYIESKDAILSPSSIRSYRTIQRNRFQGYIHLPIKDITPQMWRKAVNDEAKLVAPKTVRSAWGLLSPVITEETGERIVMHLPQVVPNDLPWLTPEQILTFAQAIEGDKYEIAAMLALSSLRVSEVLAVTWDHIDLEHNRILVAGAIVPGPDNKPVWKEANKNKGSRRVIPFILPPLRRALEAQSCREGRLVNVTDQSVRKGINRVCERAGLPLVGVHGLRRSYLSLMYHLGVPEERALRIGGWASRDLADKIYLKISEKDMLESSETFSNYFAPAKIGMEIGMNESNVIEALR